MFGLFFALAYFFWYRLNIKYFKKRINTTLIAATNEEPTYEAPATRYCTQCGSEIADNSKFCGNCGSQVVRK